MLYTYIATALISAALAFGSAWKVQAWRFGAMEAERLEAQAELVRINAKAADAAGSAHESDKAKIVVKWRTITKEVDRVIKTDLYSRECWNPDGLRVLATAISNSPTVAIPAPAVP